jgi:hypothetical protein
MGPGHLRLRQGCFLLLLLLVACASPGTGPTGATPTELARVTGAAVSPEPQALEPRLLEEIAGRICPYPQDPGRIDPYERDFSAKDGVYTFACYPATGHSVTLTMQRFADPAGAQAEFQSAAAPAPAGEFHGFPVSDWQEQHPSFPNGRFEYRVRLLQVGAWLISVRSFDDTHFLIAPDPRAVSETVLQVFAEHGVQPTSDDAR